LDNFHRFGDGLVWISKLIVIVRYLLQHLYGCGWFEFVDPGVWAKPFV